jgi:conjugal transfer pilus assembly protein TraB
VSSLDLDKKTPKQKIFEWYERLNPEMRKKVTLIGGGAIIFIIAGIMITTTSDEGTKLINNTARKVEYTLFNGKSPRDVSIDAMGGKIKKLTEDLSEVRIMFQYQDQKIKASGDAIKKQGDEVIKRTEKLNQQTTDLYQQIGIAQDALKNQLPIPAIPIDEKFDRKKDKQSKIDKQLPNLLGQPNIATESSTTPEASNFKIRVVTSVDDTKKNDKSNGATGADGTKKSGDKKISEFVNIKNASSKNGIPDMFLPAGSIMSGTLVTGLDAPTSNQSKHDPFPALLRVKHEAILPNRYRMDIRECFLIASGYGDLSAERAYMRAERMSCVKKDGTVIEDTIDAYSVGEDGKAGVRGRLVSKNGQIIANALLSGFVSGITNAFAPQKVQSIRQQVTATQPQAFNYPSAEMVGGQALMGGVKGAAEQIADYYLEMAKNIFPIIEVDAGRKIDFVIIRGVSLSAKSKTSPINNKASGQGQNQMGARSWSNQDQMGDQGTMYSNMMGNQFNRPGTRGIGNGR